MTELDRLCGVLEELGVSYSEIQILVSSSGPVAFLEMATNETVLVNRRKEVRVDGTAFMFDGSERYLGQRFKNGAGTLVTLKEES